MNINFDQTVLNAILKQFTFNQQEMTKEAGLNDGVFKKQKTPNLDLVEFVSGKTENAKEDFRAQQEIKKQEQLIGAMLKTLLLNTLMEIFGSNSKIIRVSDDNISKVGTKNDEEEKTVNNSQGLKNYESKVNKFDNQNKPLSGNQTVNKGDTQFSAQRYIDSKGGELYSYNIVDSEKGITENVYQLNDGTFYMIRTQPGGKVLADGPVVPAGSGKFAPDEKTDPSSISYTDAVKHGKGIKGIEIPEVGTTTNADGSTTTVTQNEKGEYYQSTTFADGTVFEGKMFDIAGAVKNGEAQLYRVSYGSGADGEIAPQYVYKTNDGNLYMVDKLIS